MTWRALVLLGIAATASQAAEAPQAPADAWPMSRGCPEGTGRSAAALSLPLAEHWHRDFDKTAFGATPVIAGGTIYIGDLDGTFHALLLADGKTTWSFKAEAAGFSSAAAVSLTPAEPLVVVGDDTGVVRAFDRATGKVAWEYETDGEISGGPTIIPATAGVAGEQGQRVLVGSQDASLSCLALADGRLLWKHEIADQIRCSPTVADGRVFLAGCDGKLHVIDVATGTEQAAVPIDGPTGTTPAAHEDRVFFGTEGGGFYAIDFRTANVAWKTAPAANAQAYRSSATVADGLAIVGSRGKAVEAFSIADGARRWRQPLRGRVDGSPVVVGGVVIIGDMAGRLVALDPADGKPAWEFDAGGGFTGSPAVAAGRLVIASEDGTIWCFRSENR